MKLIRYFIVFNKLFELKFVCGCLFGVLKYILILFPLFG